MYRRHVLSLAVYILKEFSTNNPTLSINITISNINKFVKYLARLGMNKMSLFQLLVEIFAT